METFAIRLATEQDIDGLVSLYAEFHTFHVLRIPDRLRKPDRYDEVALRNAMQALLHRDDARIFVADGKGKLVGLAEVYLRQDEPHPLTIAHRYGHVQSLIVSVPYRKSGLGGQLMTAVHQWAKEHQATEMQLDVWEIAEGPLHFYEARGYRTLKRHLVVDLD